MGKLPDPGSPDDRPRPLHATLLLSGLLGRIPPTLISPALLGMAAIGAWPWAAPPLQAAAGALLLVTVLGDALSLGLLPRMRRSFGPVTPPLLALALVRTAVTFALGVLWPAWPGIGLGALLLLCLTAAHVYATWIEPFRIAVTSLELVSPKLQGDAPLRLLQVSDIHFEGWTPRERRLLQLTKELEPDLILLTGDYLNLSSVDCPTSRDGARDLLASLSSVAPTYAISGSPPVDRPDVVPAIFADLAITWLLGRTADVRVKGHHLRLVGLRCTRDRKRDGLRLHRLLPDGVGEVFTLLLYHSPDLMPDAVETGVDLYLAGHTHGGQLRLPLIGALVTSSDFWKQYEAGLYRSGGTTLYVCRGLGSEGMGAPRARFLAPPELVLLSLCPAADAPGAG